MSGATPVEMLEAEHRVIQKMVAGMAVLAERLEGERTWMSPCWRTSSSSSVRLPIAATMVKKRLSCSRPWNAVVYRRTDAQLAA